MIDLAAFEGDWLVSRRIADDYSGQEGQFEGTARFVPEGDGLRYEEAGTLIMGGAVPMRAERAYLWDARAGEIVVRFADGRPFHHFATTPAPEAEHLCGEDLYEVRYDFGHWPDWRAVWRVSGPRKAYEMTSQYQRR